jgi:hypothetical protein
MIFVNIVRVSTIRRIAHYAIHYLAESSKRITCNPASVSDIRVIPVVALLVSIKLERRGTGHGEYVSSSRIVVYHECTFRLVAGRIFYLHHPSGVNVVFVPRTFRVENPDTPVGVDPHH